MSLGSRSRKWDWRTSRRSVAIFAATLGVATFDSTDGSAHPGFPSRLQSDLALPNTPPCNTCHVDPNGGGPLRPFGSLLVSTYNLSSSEVENDASLDQALAGLRVGDPQLVEDLQAGRDPNGDASGNSRPVPMYGCAASPRTSSASEFGPWVLGVLGFLVFGRCFRRARRA